MGNDDDDDECLEILSNMCGEIDMNLDKGLVESNNMKAGNIFHGLK